jgi:putative DNA primase/helicase
MVSTFNGSLTTATFDIRDHLDKLTPTKSKNRYICPVCDGHNLTIEPNTGEYQCWNGCLCPEIREALAPWAQREQPNAPQALRKPQQKEHTPTPAPLPSESIHLATLPNPVSPPTRVSKGNKTEITYPYSDTQWVLRIESPDPKKPKGYSKVIYPYHVNIQGKEVSGKGDKAWSAYRMGEVRQYGAGRWVLGHEGEDCVDLPRSVLSLVSFTLQGSAWTDEALYQAMQSMKSAGVAGVVFWPDNDNTGYGKAQKMALAAALVQLPFVQIDPTQLWSECPPKGDIVDWLKWGMAQGINPEEFIKRLEEEIHRVVSLRRSPAPNADSLFNIPNSANPNVTFLQQALNFLYGDKPWISCEDKLYCWTLNYYKHSSNAVERKRIAHFCNTFSVEDKEGNITYPYAKPSKVREVLQWVKDMTEVDKSELNPPGVNCTNGVLQLHWQGTAPSWKLENHNPSFYYTYEPIVTYDPTADPTNCNRLLDVLDKPQQEILLRTIAASLDLKKVRKHKGRLVRGLLLKGDGNNGKDTIREAVAAMYGYQGMTGCTISDFKAYDEGRKFPLARLENSRVNWATENANTAALDKLQSIKAFLTGDTLSTEGKGKDEYDYTPTAVGLFNINDTPNLRGTLEAITSRLGILSFIKTFKIGADPTKGEIEADPRFKYDPDFMREQVLPAFLNRVLQALVDLMEHGIDYSCTEKALEDIQRENSHLFEFCSDLGCCYNPNSTITAGEIWQLLEQWYMDNGTLSYEESGNGKRKALWIDQSRKSDANVKGANQVIARFRVLFPKAKVTTVQGDTKGKPRMALQGIGFNLLNPSVNPIFDELTQGLTQGLTLEPLQNKEVNPVNPIFPNCEKNQTELNEVYSCAMSDSAVEPQNWVNRVNTPDTARVSGLTTELTSGLTITETGLTQPDITKGARVRVHCLGTKCHQNLGTVSSIFPAYGKVMAKVKMDDVSLKIFECFIPGSELMWLELIGEN